MNFYTIPQNTTLCPECGYPMRGHELVRYEKHATIECRTSECSMRGRRFVLPLQELELRELYRFDEAAPEGLDPASVLAPRVREGVVSMPAMASSIARQP